MGRNEVRERAIPAHKHKTDISHHYLEENGGKNKDFDYFCTNKK